jgi:hypothetical protein
MAQNPQRIRPLLERARVIALALIPADLTVRDVAELLRAHRRAVARQRLRD